MLSDFLGIPFVERGRTREGCDCYGLVRIVLADVYGKSLPLFDTEYADLSDRTLEERLINEGLSAVAATKLDAPEPGCIVTMEYNGRASHVGVMLSKTYVMHTEPFKSSHIEPISSIHIRNRIREFYRVD